MNSVEQIIRELEDKRKILNERLMNSATVAEANKIERELWALRASIQYHKRANKNLTSAAARAGYCESRNDLWPM
jgi:hypothetical protein